MAAAVRVLAVAALLALAAAVPTTRAASKAVNQTRPRAHKGAGPDTPAGILVFTRFNCAFPFCPTTALDVCAADEHFESNRPYVLATLIPQTTTSEMNFFAYSDFDNSTRLHYTLAARPGLVSVFTVAIALNGTAGNLVREAPVVFPDTLQLTDITYLFTFGGYVYVSFTTGDLVKINPKTGAIVSDVNVLTPAGDYQGSYGSVFDQQTGTFYVNAQGDAGFFLAVVNVATGKTNMLGPLPPAAGTAGPSNTRVDNALASLVVYPPPSVGGGMKLMEMRNSNDFPYLFMAWLDPVTGESTLLYEDWYLNYELDPQIFPTQWTGSNRRVWAYDPVNAVAWFKMYDECGGNGDDDCVENETILYLPWVPPNYIGWGVAVEPIEPQLTQMLWVWTNVVN